MNRFVTTTKTWNKLFGMGLVAAALGGQAGFAQAEVIQQTFDQAPSGALNFGQNFELDSAIFSSPQELESIVFARGQNTTGTTSIYLDIYAIGTANISTLNFNPTNPTTGVSSLSYLGSSDNAINVFAATAGSALEWTFNGIVLPTDTALFAVVSNDSVAGNHRGVSLRASRQNISGTFFGGAVYNNTNAADSTPLFGGTVTPDVEGELVNDNFYTITVVPEPSSLALLGLGGLLVARRRNA